jgi:hypothetical protein
MLYTRVLEAVEKSGKGLPLKIWYESTKSYWILLSQLLEPFCFEDLTSIKTSVGSREAVHDVKFAIEKAFQKHSEEFIFELEKFYEAVEDADSVDDLIGRLPLIPNLCKFNSDGNSCAECLQAASVRESFLSILNESEAVSAEIRDHTQNMRKYLAHELRQIVLAKEVELGRSAELKQELDAILEEYGEAEAWLKFKQLLSTRLTVVSATWSLENEIRRAYASLPHLTERLPLRSDQTLGFESLEAFELSAYDELELSPLVSYKNAEPGWEEAVWLETQLEDMVKAVVAELGGDTFYPSSVREVKRRAHDTISKFEQDFGQNLLPDFKTELHFYALVLLNQKIVEKEVSWNQKHSPIIQLTKKIKQFPRIFNNEI